MRAVQNGTGVEDRTLLLLFVGQGLSTRKRPRRILAVGAGFEPARGLGNSQLPYRLATPQEIWSGTSDSNRDSLGPRPSGLIHFPSPRIAYNRRGGADDRRSSSAMRLDKTGHEQRWPVLQVILKVL